MTSELVAVEVAVEVVVEVANEVGVEVEVMAVISQELKYKNVVTIVLERDHWKLKTEVAKLKSAGVIRQFPEDCFNTFHLLLLSPCKHVQQ